MSAQSKSKVVVYLSFFASIIFSSLAVISLTNELLKVSGIIITLFWLFSIAFATIFATNLNLKSRNKEYKFDHQELFFVSAILLFSFVYLVKDIETLPYVVHGDEAEQALNALRIVQSMPPHIFNLGWYDIPYMSFIINIPAIHIIGFSLFGLRITSVIEALVVILTTYYLAKLCLKNKLLAGLSSLTLLTTPTFIHFARSGASYMQAVSAVTVAIYFYLKTLESKNKYLYFYLAGLMSGFGFLLYYAGRVALFIILLSIPLSLLTKKIAFKHILLFVFGFFVMIAPYVPVWVKNPTQFNSRTNDVLIFKEWVHVTNGQTDTPVFEVLGSQIYKTLGFFVNYPDQSEQFRIQDGGFTIPLTVFMIVGLVLLVLRFFKNGNFVLLFWFFSCIGAVAVTIDSPFAPRLVSITPVVSIIALYGVEYVSNLINNLLSRFLPVGVFPKKIIFWSKISLSIAIVMVFVLVGTKKYFINYKSKQPDNAYTVIGRFLAKNSAGLGKKKVCIFTDQRLLANYPTFLLLAPDAKTKITNLSQSNSDCQAYIFSIDYEKDIKLLTKNKKLRSLDLQNYDGKVIFKSLIP